MHSHYNSLTHTYSGIEQWQYFGIPKLRKAACQWPRNSPYTNRTLTVQRRHICVLTFGTMFQPTYYEHSLTIAYIVLFICYILIELGTALYKYSYYANNIFVSIYYTEYMGSRMIVLCTTLRGWAVEWLYSFSIDVSDDMWQSTVIERVQIN